MRETIRCFWCNSSDTYFKHIENWEEDIVGNAITTSDVDERYSPRDEVWWCNACEGAFAFPFEPKL